MRQNKSENGTTNNREITPEEVVALMNFAYLLFENGRSEEARRILDGLSILDSDNPYVPGLLGAIYHKQEKLDEAAQHYTRALALLPSDLHSLVNRGEIFLVQGKFVEAAADLKRAIALDSDGKHPAANRGRLLAAVTQEALELAKAKGVRAVLEAKKQINETAS